MKDEKYAVEKIVQEFYGQSMTEDEGFIAPDFFAMAREICNLRGERDALLKVYEAAEDFIGAQGTQYENDQYLMLCGVVGAYNQQ